ncbi:MAG: hypothetical protein GY894_08425 [Planctomycetes bacterium]|jgi:hypothetical protein|nr:hypothetical protein [Planctomycetota bacterium]MCP4839367.1 hypothetical protein [Planctomycetota bacterium]
MHRPGCNPDDVQPQDVLCDFCGRAAWAEDIPCVEGHRGSLICGDCLELACASSVYDSDQTDNAIVSLCVLCLQESDGGLWRHEFNEAGICKRCMKQAAGVLSKSKDWNWNRPA